VLDETAFELSTFHTMQHHSSQVCLQIWDIGGQSIGGKMLSRLAALAIVCGWQRC
jgi:hypothetical protein